MSHIMNEKNFNYGISFERKVFLKLLSPQQHTTWLLRPFILVTPSHKNELPFSSFLLHRLLHHQQAANSVTGFASYPSFCFSKLWLCTAVPSDVTDSCIRPGGYRSGPGPFFNARFFELTGRLGLVGHLHLWRSRQRCQYPLVQAQSARWSRRQHAHNLVVLLKIQ